MSDPSDTRPMVGIVVVGHNEKPLVSDCFKSLRTIDYTPLLVVYADNESSDGSLEHVRAEFPEVLALPSGGNLGYCGGNNVGISRALEAGAGFVLILNPDTIVCNPGFMTTLVDYMLAHPDVGKVGPTVYLRERGNVQNTILGWPSILGSFFSVLRTQLRHAGTARSATVTAPTAVDSLNGCCLLVRAEALRNVGLYDAGFWCYMDEVDWDWQAAQAGWNRHYVPVESIVHLQKMSGYDFAGRANYYMKRNTALWYAKTGKWFSMIIWMVVTVLIALIRGVISPLLGRSPAKYFQFVGKLVVAYAGVLKDLAAGNLHRQTPVPSANTVPGRA